MAVRAAYIGTMSIRLVMLAVMVVLLGPGVGESQHPFTVTWTPSAPLQGTVVLIRVEADSTFELGTGVLHGQLAGQALHFDRLGDGAFVALGGVPLSGEPAHPMRLTYVRDGEIVVRATYTVDVRSADYPVDQLTVAPRFGRQPDSVTQARIDRERILETEAARGSHSTPRFWDGPFVRPRSGRITSGYGTAREFNGTIQSRHWGVDIDGVEGAPVRAAHRGVVRLVGDHYYSGNLIYVDHGGGLVTAYRHLSRVEVAVGDTVEQGELIGRVGATGRVTGPHLHWTVRYGTLTLDGMSLLELALPSFSDEPVGAPRD